MRAPFSFLRASASGGSVPVVVGVSYGVVDTAGGGQRLVVEVDDSTGCTAIAVSGGVMGSVSFTSFAIDDATHVSGIPGAHASGVVGVVVTNASGDSTTGTGLLEYFAPHDLSPNMELLPGAYTITGTQGLDAVGKWDDASGQANYVVKAGGSNTVPADSGSGTPVFDYTVNNHLSCGRVLAQASGDGVAEIDTGTIVSFFTPTRSFGAIPEFYQDAGVCVGAGANPGICYNDSGFQFEAYDHVSGLYMRPDSVAAAIDVAHCVAGRWNLYEWACIVNGTKQTVTNTAGELSTSNVGVLQVGGGTYPDAISGTHHCLLVYPVALSDADVEKIRQWGRQRGIAA
jgi:hypothetical protein